MGLEDGGRSHVANWKFQTKHAKALNGEFEALVFYLF